MKYLVNLKIGYCDAKFKFDDGEEAIHFLENLADHLIDEEKEDKVSIMIVVEKEDM